MRSLPPALVDAAAAPPPPCPPVEYGAAVDRFLAQSPLGPGSRRVYRISLTGWAWPLVGRPVPVGAERRGAVPPLVPLAVLDDPRTAGRLAAAAAGRAAAAGPRTVNRELSALRSATAWWLAQRWIHADPAASLRPATQPAPAHPPLTRDQVTRLLRAAPSLRDHALWRLIHDSGAPADAVLRLDIGQLDLAGRRTRPRAAAGPIHWRAGTGQLLRWLLAGRTDGPVFLAGRRAPAGTPTADICPVTGRARLSYRRAAEIFTEVTRLLDPAGQGWALHQLARARSDRARAGRR